MDVIKPEALKKGDTIGVITPASPLTKNRLDLVNLKVRQLEAMGYRVHFGRNYNKELGHKAGTSEERLSDLMDMFEDKDIKAIITARGGYNSNELLDSIDYSIIRKNPKIFCGFSDITFLHCAIHTKTGLATFYGPNLNTRFALPGEDVGYTLNYFNKVLTEENDRLKIMPSSRFTFLRELEIPEDKLYATVWKTLKEGSAEGKLVGGHIFTFLDLAGTEYFPDFSDKILFWEDTESTTALTDRSLHQMKMLGIFDEIKGMIVGRTNDLEYKTDDQDYPLDKIIIEATKGYDFPIISGMDFGHTTPMFTIPYGITARIYATESEQRFELMESAVI
ncbi:LD-carboxypeptidase [Candidatus Marsarchaeota archaeon]|nr:LD-carboxypeptidase [Candidatus Marsarchaeota archaeon]